MSKAKTRVLLVDDHPMVRRGLAALVAEEPDLMVCGEAGDVPTARELAASAKPDLAIIDIELKGYDGLELIKELHSRHPHIRFLVLSMHEEEIYAERALRAGSTGFVKKADAADTVMTAIRRVLAGEIYASPTVIERLLHQAIGYPGRVAASSSPVERLSDRELQIFRLLGEGMKVSATAAQLFLSVKTVERHRANIRKKLGIANSAELLRYAIQYFRARE